MNCPVESAPSTIAVAPDVPPVIVSPLVKLPARFAVSLRVDPVISCLTKEFGF